MKLLSIFVVEMTDQICI